MEQKKREERIIIFGITPSADPTIGNYSLLLSSLRILEKRREK